MSEIIQKTATGNPNGKPAMPWDGEWNQGYIRRIPCLVYSRVVGYMTPTSQWNDGKKAEFADRKPFDVSEVLSQ